MRYPYTLFFIILILWGCSGREADPGQQASAGLSADTTQPVYRIAIEDSVRFGSTDEHVVGVGGVLSDAQNRVYITDNRSHLIHVFNEEGRYVTQMAGEGKGPGMSMRMSAVQIAPDHLYLFDRSLFRIGVYSLEELSHSYTIPLNVEDWSDDERLKNRYVGNREFFVDHDGGILMGFHYNSVTDPEFWESDDNIENNTIQYYRLNQEGKVTSDLVFEQQGAKRIVYEWKLFGAKTTTTFGFMGEPLFAMSGDGTMAAARTTEFKIKVYSSEGDLENVITYPFEKTPLKRETLIEDSDSQDPKIEAYKTMDLPDTWHALGELLFDDQNRLWVATIVPDLEVYKWVVFDTEGQLLARFTWPRDKPIQDINGGYMYTSQDDESGERYIVRYKIELREH